MIIKNCKIIFQNGIESGSILIKNGIIAAINPKSYSDTEIIDGQGLYLSPGFIDIHIHGSGGYDVMDGKYESLNNISKTICNHGTTSFLATTMTCSIEDIHKAVNAAANAMERGTHGANILGIHLEGPFINVEMLGAQNPDFVQSPSIDTFNKIVGDNLNIIKTVTIAPELEGSKELIEYLRELGIVSSIGHSKANYKQTISGIASGISHSTHLYNAMTSLHHREPGIVGAIFDSDITTETIADGIHINYPALRIAYKQKGLDKVVLITDAMMACCMPDGRYSLGGQDVFVENGAARLQNGSLAGSTLTLDKAVRNVYKNSSYKLYEIIKMVTYNPAKLLKLDNKIGSIKEGLDADFVLFDDEINIKRVIIKGKAVNTF